MEASYNGYFEIAKFLMENNADVNIQDNVFFLKNIDLSISSLYSI
jgi:hypothetical protein